MSKFDTFWTTLNLCDWSHEGYDALVLAPVIDHLAALSDEDIFAFDDLMSELLYRLDTRTLAKKYHASQGLFSDDGFLYSRCVALINGPAFYDRVAAGELDVLWDMEFESLLYVPANAWAKKHCSAPNEYPHLSPLSYETGSNKEGWEV